jgi:hypothetical protein
LPRKARSDVVVSITPKREPSEMIRGVAERHAEF